MQIAGKWVTQYGLQQINAGILSANTWYKLLQSADLTQHEPKAPGTESFSGNFNKRIYDKVKTNDKDRNLVESS